MVVSASEKDEAYWQLVRDIAEAIESDGCTGVIDFYLDCCLEHDIAYRLGCNIFGEPLSRAQADASLRRCIQAKSRFGRLSPMAFLRWLGVRVFGRKSYRGSMK
jgi:hypothetical protein